MHVILFLAHLQAFASMSCSDNFLPIICLLTGFKQHLLLKCLGEFSLNIALSIFWREEKKDMFLWQLVESFNCPGSVNVT